MEIQYATNYGIFDVKGEMCDLMVLSRNFRGHVNLYILYAINDRVCNIKRRYLMHRYYLLLRFTLFARASIVLEVVREILLW